MTTPNSGPISQLPPAPSINAGMMLPCDNPLVLPYGQTQKFTITQLTDYIESLIPAFKFPWSNISGVSQNALINNGYNTTNSALTTINLPATCVVGDIVRVQNSGTGGFRVQAATGQVIYLLGVSTALSGYAECLTRHAYAEFMCITDNNEWNINVCSSVSVNLV